MTPRRSTEGWQRNVWALTALCVHRVRGFQFFNPFLPLYIRELGVTDPARIALWSGLLAAVTPAISDCWPRCSAAWPIASGGS